jgi:hypothetical protein
MSGRALFFFLIVLGAFGVNGPWTILVFTNLSTYEPILFRAA